MRFLSTPLPGVFVIELELLVDERGSFARSWCATEFEAHGLVGRIAQSNVSHNKRRGTLRGLHFQAPPHEETKVVRCTRGRIFDVAVDLRRESPTYLRWFGTELSADDRRALYVPRGMAHGFQSLEDDTEVTYLMSEPYEPAAARGLPWNDPAFGIAWPLPDAPILSERDASHPPFVP